MKILSYDRSIPARAILGAVSGAIIAALFTLTQASEPAAAQTSATASGAAASGTKQARKSVSVPMVDPRRGRKLFVTKGCFICHSVKGVGSKVAPALDAPHGSTTIDVVGFVARMWNGAPIMSELQSVELGYRIKFTADELADLAGFVGDPDAQKGFSVEEIPELVREWMLKEAWWKDPSDADWRKTLPSEFPDLDSLKEGP